MKGAKNRKKPAIKRPGQMPAPVTEHRMIPVDERPMRKHAATELDQAMAKLDKARAEWRRFEEQDRAAYSQWLAATFGVLLTEFRENERQIHEQTLLIEEVKLEMIWGRSRNPRRAYAVVMERRSKPDTADNPADARAAGRSGASHGDREQEGDPWEDLDADEDGEVPEAERREMFDDFLKSVFGINPRDVNKAEYARMFADFQADVFGDRGPSGRAEAPHAAKPSAGRDEARIKEIYRTLARRLHPDLQEAGTRNVPAIWHDVQEAYANRNLERLETLLALTEIQSGSNAGDVSLSQLQAALEELKRGLKAMRRSISEAKRDPAWMFSQARDHAPREKRMRRELKLDLEEQRCVLADFKRTLDDWSRPWEPPVRKPRKESASPVRAKAARAPREGQGPSWGQAELFDFF